MYSEELVKKQYRQNTVEHAYWDVLANSPKPLSTLILFKLEYFKRHFGSYHKYIAKTWVKAPWKLSLRVLQKASIHYW